MQFGINKKGEIVRTKFGYENEKHTYTHTLMQKLEYLSQQNSLRCQKINVQAKMSRKKEKQYEKQQKNNNDIREKDRLKEKMFDETGR